MQDKNAQLNSSSLLTVDRGEDTLYYKEISGHNFEEFKSIEHLTQYFAIDPCTNELASKEISEDEFINFEPPSLRSKMSNKDRRISRGE